MHRPPPQASPAAQGRPQAPQFIGSLRVSTQTPPQRTCPAGHAPAPQRPAAQAIPAGQVMPQTPQFIGSPCVSMHDPPQSDCPAGHPAAHAPATHG